MRQGPPSYLVIHCFRLHSLTRYRGSESPFGCPREFPFPAGLLEYLFLCDPIHRTLLFPKGQSSQLWSRCLEYSVENACWLRWSDSVLVWSSRLDCGHGGDILCRGIGIKDWSKWWRHSERIGVGLHDNLVPATAHFGAAVCGTIKLSIRYRMPEEYDDGWDYFSVVWIYIYFNLTLRHGSAENEGSIKIGFICMQ